MSTVATAKTEPTLPHASASPTPPPATRRLKLSTQPSTTFVAVSSLTSRVSAGTSAAWAGRVVTTAVAATTAPRYASSGGEPARMNTAVAASATACTAYPPARISTGERRSAIDATNGATTAAGTSWASATRPEAVTPPWSNA